MFQLNYLLGYLVTLLLLFRKRIQKTHLNPNRLIVDLILEITLNCYLEALRLFCSIYDKI